MNHNPIFARPSAGPIALLGPVLRVGARLQSRHWILLLDIAWVIALSLQMRGIETILNFHLLFVFLTLGAFYWTFKGFAVRAGVAGSLGVLGIVLFALRDVIPDEELVEIPALVAILFAVFLIARQRTKAMQELQALNGQLESRVMEKTAGLEAEIQERRQAEQTLLNSREQYRRLVELSFEAIIIHANERVLHMNQAALQLLGAASPEAVIGRSLFDFIAPDSVLRVRQRLQQIAASAYGLPPVEEKFVRLDGSQVDVEVATIETATIEAAAGGSPAMLTVVRDITPRKQAEQARLAERMSIARDLHDSLGQNLGYLHLKLDQLTSCEEEQLPSAMHGELVRMRNVANEAYQQVRGIIAANLPANNAPFVRMLRAKAQSISERSQIAVTVVERGRAHDLNTVVQEQVLSLCGEALTNVAKHSGATQVRVMVCWFEHGMTVSARDNGCGFDVAEAQRKPCFGLKVMEQRAAQVHGQLRITSQPGRGTKVSLRVPLPSTALAYRPRRFGEMPAVS